MYLEVSIGEALDKLSILDIKVQRISDPTKRAAVVAEQQALSEVRALAVKHSLLYSLLVDTNQTIWSLTDTVKTLVPTNPQYATVAQRIFDENQVRFRIKTLINSNAQSSLQEQKSYSESEICVDVTNPRIASSALWTLALQYDTVFIAGENTSLLKPMFRSPTFRYDVRANAIVDVSVPIDAIERKMPSPIRYVAGGRLGDFVHQLSVVYERYLQTGRRGVLYLGELDVGGDRFARGVQNTLADISPLLMTLPYIHSLEAYAGQQYDVHLSQWRLVPSLYSKSWQEIYGEMYGISWSAHPWLTSSLRSDLSGVVLICTTPVRWTNDVNWSAFLKTLTGTPMFLRISDSEYQHFRQCTGLDIPCVDVSNFTEIVTAIHSCKLFVGTLSMPLAVADALHKQRIAITQAGSPDEMIAIRTNPNYVHRF